MEIIGNVKTYDWGKLGAESEVARLANLNNPNFKLENNTPFSELWMGDHVSGPSKIKTTGQDLGDFIQSHESEGTLIGGHSKLPFLFKVLSIRKALSIQVHPNKTEAERLHREFPEIYKDSNHKPELAIALTPFTAMCGFRPYEEIVKFCDEIKSLSHLLGDENIEKLKVASEGDKQNIFKNCFENLMTADSKTTSKCIKEILENYLDVLDTHNLKDVFLTVNKDFPDDAGILCLFLLNVINLKPGEAIYLGANEIHAYLNGDCIECMACSDNVVRAGLTPKYKDVGTLIKMLNYHGDKPAKKLYKPRRIDDFMEIFVPEIPDFAVIKICIPSRAQNKIASYKMKSSKFGSILLVLQGRKFLRFCDNSNEAKELLIERGSIIFLPGNYGEDLEFTGAGVTDSCGVDSEDFVGYMALYNSFL